MKLFVWDNPYSVPWGDSLLFAVAETEEEAKRIAITEGKLYKGPEVEGQPDLPHCFTLGAPTRVVNLPCAEWHEWEE